MASSRRDLPDLLAINPIQENYSSDDDDKDDDMEMDEIEVIDLTSPIQSPIPSPSMDSISPPLSPSSSSASDSSESIEEEESSLYDLVYLMGANFMENANRDDLYDFCQNLTAIDWWTISFYAQLAEAVDSVSDIRLQLLAALDQAVPVDDTDNSV